MPATRQSCTAPSDAPANGFLTPIALSEARHAPVESCTAAPKFSIVPCIAKRWPSGSVEVEPQTNRFGNGARDVKLTRRGTLTESSKELVPVRPDTVPSHGPSSASSIAFPSMRIEGAIELTRSAGRDCFVYGSTYSAVVALILYSKNRLRLLGILRDAGAWVSPMGLPP